MNEIRSRHFGFLIKTWNIILIKRASIEVAIANFCSSIFNQVLNHIFTNDFNPKPKLTTQQFFNIKFANTKNLKNFSFVISATKLEDIVTGKKKKRINYKIILLKPLKLGLTWIHCWKTCLSWNMRTYIKRFNLNP